MWKEKIYWDIKTEVIPFNTVYIIDLAAVNIKFTKWDYFMSKKRKLRRLLKNNKVKVLKIPFITKELSLPKFETNTKQIVAESCNIKTCLEDMTRKNNIHFEYFGNEFKGDKTLTLEQINKKYGIVG